MVGFPKMRVLLFFALFCGAVSAQNVQSANVRFYVVGRDPLWREEIVDGIRQQIVLPGELPPPTVVAPNGDYPDNRFTLRTDSMTTVRAFSPKVAEIELQELDKGSKKDWLSVPMPTSPLSLGVLFEDPTEAKMSWFKPKMLMFKDDVKAFPLQHFRLINVSDKTGFAIVNREAKVVKPGAFVVVPLNEGDNKVLIGFQTDDGRRPDIFNNFIVGREGQRVQGFLHRVRGKSGTNAVKFVQKIDRIPRPVVLPKAR